MNNQSITNKLIKNNSNDSNIYQLTIKQKTKIQILFHTIITNMNKKKTNKTKKH